MAITLLCRTCHSVLEKVDDEGWFCNECDQFKLKGENNVKQDGGCRATDDTTEGRIRG